MNIIDGRKPAVTSESEHSAFTWFITVPMMSQKPITKNPASIGRRARFFFMALLYHKSAQSSSTYFARMRKSERTLTVCRAMMNLVAGRSSVSESVISSRS